jgi:hypothetical protein
MKGILAASDRAYQPTGKESGVVKQVVASRRCSAGGLGVENSPSSLGMARKECRWLRLRCEFCM